MCSAIFKVNQLEHLKGLEKENNRLRNAVSDSTPDKLTVKEATSESF